MVESQSFHAYSARHIVRNHLILPIGHKSIHILEETRLIGPLLRREIDISATC